MNAGVSTPRRCCPVIELRQYTPPGQRDVLIDLFDRHFVESQEAAGMTIVGQFRDRRRPDRFVWIRGFPTWRAAIRRSSVSTEVRVGGTPDGRKRHDAGRE